MKKEIFIVIALAIIIVVLIGLLMLPEPVTNTQPQGNGGIQIILPIANTKISSPLKITGTVNGNGWAGFEGQVGIVELLDSNNKSIAFGVLTATTEWTTLPTNFETILNFQSSMAQPATLVFQNENPSGLPEKDKTFSIPVKIIKSSGEIMKVKAYFNNNKMDPEISCNKVFAVEREILKTNAVATAAIEELLKGPTDTEKNSGFSTSINEGVKIQSLIIEDGTAKVDFNEQLGNGVAGSCKVSAIRAEITETLKQFPTVKNIVISINGRTEDILQP